MKPHEESVILWGPPYSGKTSLFYGFVKRLERLTVTSSDFFFEVLDAETGFPFEIDLGEEGTHPTDRIKDQLLLVRRTPKKKTEAHQLSSAFQYRLRVTDYPGGQAIDSISDRFNNELLYSNNYIIALDPQVKSAEMESTTGDELKGKKAYTKEEYVHDIKILHSVLDAFAKNKANKINIAICVTKIDQEKTSGFVNTESQFISKEEEIEENIIRAFGKELMTEVERLQKNDQAFEVRLFLTSAAGFYYDSTSRKIVSNAVPGVKGSDNLAWLKEKKKWNPVGVERPFFWFFDQHEDKSSPEQKTFYSWMWPQPERITWLDAST